MDELIKNTDVSYRALAMPYFMENLLVQTETIKNQGMFFLANAADRPLATVATADIAAVAVRLLLDGSHTFANGLERDHAAVLRGLTLPYSSGAVEGKVGKIKFWKRLMFGRANLDLLRKMAPWN
jgi:hypothetical protein